MKEKVQAPELRFEGFTDDWEERKVSEITDFHKQGFYTKESYNENKKYYLLRGTDMTSNKLILKDTPKINASEKDYEDFKVLKDDFLIVRSGTVGTYAIVKSDITAIFGSYLINFRFNQSIVLNEFFGLFYQSSLFKSQLNKIIQKSSNVNINAENIKSTNIKFPTIEEQQKIGAFFQSIDDTIALHQRKLDLLKEQKKGYLQKMFPKNGAKVPELRFAGFADDWEQRKLSDVANHRGGTAIEKYFDKDGVYKVISIGSYGLNSQYVDQNIRAISNEITDGRVVNSGELTMVLNDKTANGTIIGRTLLVEKDNEYVINQRTEIISPKENFDSSFAYTILNGPFREKVKRIVQGGTQIYVNYPAVSNLNLELPEIEEQQKIGSFFKQLDDTIALHQRKLDLLKEQKKGFLQKMFV